MCKPILPTVAAELLGTNGDSAPQRGWSTLIFGRGCQRTCPRPQPLMAKPDHQWVRMSPCQSVEFYPRQRGKDDGVAIQLERQTEAYEKKKLNQWYVKKWLKTTSKKLVNEHKTFGKPSVGSVIPSVQRWLREPPGTDAEAEAQSLPKVSHLVGGQRRGRNPPPKAKPSSFSSWKFTLICSEGEHGAPAAKELSYAGGSGDVCRRPLVA